jgi:serine/threonine protein kinase
VLFSECDRHWKLADFGTATKATSKRLHTTRYTRGTTGYCAPEILREDARVNNKVDMFAVGCILYEVTTGRKLFPNDWNIHEYALKGESVFPSLWPMCESRSRLFSLAVLAQSLLEVNPFRRPTAVGTDGILQLIRKGRVLVLGQLDGIQERVTSIHPPSPPHKITVTQVNYRYSAPTRPAPVHLPSIPVVSLQLLPWELVTMEGQARMLGATPKHPVGGGTHSTMPKSTRVN